MSSVNNLSTVKLNDMKKLLIIIGVIVSAMAFGQTYDMGGATWRQIMYIQYYYQQKYIEHCETDSTFLYMKTEVVPTGDPVMDIIKVTEVYDKNVTPTFEGYHLWLREVLSDPIRLDIANPK